MTVSLCHSSGGSLPANQRCQSRFGRFRCNLSAGHRDPEHQGFMYGKGSARVLAWWADDASEQQLEFPIAFMRGSLP